MDSILNLFANVFSIQANKSNHLATERAASLETEADELREEAKKIKAENEGKARAEHELQEALEALTQQMDMVSGEKEIVTGRVVDLEREVESLKARCNEVMRAKELMQQAI